MRNCLIILVIAAAVLLINSYANTGQITESCRDIVKGKKITIKPLGWYQDCNKFEPDDTIKIEFSSLKPVKFSSRCKRNTMESIVALEEPPTDSYEGNFKVQADEVYCFMWHNKNLEYITVTYDICVESN